MQEKERYNIALSDQDSVSAPPAPTWWGYFKADAKSFAQASILLQDDIPDEHQLIRLADVDPPVPQVLLLSFEMCRRDDRALTFAFILAPSPVKADHQVLYSKLS